MVVKYSQEVIIYMETKNILFELRTKKGLSQGELAEKIYVTRQAVSRWETGETVPNTETLKLLSKLFDVSINTLLGSPRKLICQCCGMPLDDSSISKENDGTFNEEYCKWCYADGKFVYTNLEQLTDFLVEHMSNESFPPEQARTYFEAQLPKLNYWKQNSMKGGE
jgi:Predicted transcriptional regulators